MTYQARVLFLSCFLLTLALPLSAQSKRAHKWYMKGVELMKDRDHKSATLKLTKSIRAYKKFKKAYALRGECLYELGEIQIALVDLEKAVELGVETEQPYRILIAYHWSDRAFGDVIRILDYKEKVHPDDLSILEYRSRVYEEKGDDDLAEKSWRDLLHKIPPEEERRRQRIRAKIESF